MRADKRRTWTDQELIAAVAASSTWTETLRRIGAPSVGGTHTRIQKYAAELGIDSSHFSKNGIYPVTPSTESIYLSADPDKRLLRKAAPMWIAGWLTERGFTISWPLEPQSFDLIASRGQDSRRIQVKTTNLRHGEGWEVQIGRQEYVAEKAVSSNGKRRRTSYSSTEVDDIFVLTGGGGLYAIPLEKLNGAVFINLGTSYGRYEAFKIDDNFTTLRS